MADENEAGGLSADEQAYFDSRGEKEIPAPAPPETEKVEAAVEPAKQAEAPEPKPAETEDEGDKPVPLRALSREKEKVKNLRAEIEKERTQRAVLEDRWNMVIQRFNQSEPEPPAAPPNPDEDIFGALKYQSDRVAALEKQLLARSEQEQQSQVERQIEAAIWGGWEDDARGFAAQQPDFGEAAKWLAEARDKQLAAYASVDPRFANKAIRDAQMNAELRDIVINARRNNVSPAEAVYGIAKSWGFNSTPVPAASVTPAAPATPPEKAIADLAKAIDGETSLAATGGSAPKASIEPQDVAEMSADEFEAWLAKAGDKGFKRMMEGVR